jgi:hypothetical protein
MNLPQKQQKILRIMSTDSLYTNYNLDKNIIVKKIVDNYNNFNYYRWDKILDKNINPSYFFYYYKDPNIRCKLNNLIKNINIVNQTNENNWIETFELYDRIFKVKIESDNYQLVGYTIDEKSDDILSSFKLFNFMIREVNGQYLVRFEIVYDLFDMDQEIELVNQIKAIEKLEKLVLGQKSSE